MIPIARLDLKEKEKNLSFVHPVAKLLYCLSYDASVSSKVNVYSMQNYSHVLSCCFVWAWEMSIEGTTQFNAPWEQGILEKMST